MGTKRLRNSHLLWILVGACLVALYWRSRALGLQVRQLDESEVRSVSASRLSPNESIATCREVIRSNVIEVRDAYRKRARWHRRFFRTSGILVLVLSASLPLLALLSYEGKDFVVATVGVAVALLTGLRAFYGWDQMWGLLRQSDFELTHLLGEWELDVAATRGLPEADRSLAIYALTRDLLNKANGIRQAESQKFFGALRFPDGTQRDESRADHRAK